MSCETNIPSEWQSAIATNNCPKCGDVIMDDVTKQLFDELHSLMKRLEEAPEGIKELLLSNYDLVTTAQVKKMGPENMPNNLKVAHNPVQQYLARSAAPKLAERENLRDLVKRIQDVQAEENDAGMLMIDSNSIMGDVPMQQSSSLAKTVLQNNSVLISGDSEPHTDADKQALVAALASAGDDVEGIEDLPPALQQDRLRRLEQRRRVASGASGKKGTFRRG